MSVKWLELLKQIAPGVTRAAVLRDPTVTSGIGQFGAIQGAASSFGVEVVPLGVHDGADIERAIAGFARETNNGLIVTTGALTTLHRALIAALATRHKLPAVYPARFFAAAGGLIFTVLTGSNPTAVRPATSIASSRARSRPTFRCKRRPNTNW